MRIRPFSFLGALVIAPAIMCLGFGAESVAAQTCPNPAATINVSKNSPASEVSYYAFGDLSDGTGETLNFWANQSYALITNIVPPPIHKITVSVNTNGVPPGVYCARFSWSGTFVTKSAIYTVGYGEGYNEVQIFVSGPGSGVFLIDPVPDLVSGGTVKTSDQLQNSLSMANVVKAVQGVAADGVTQLLVRIDSGGGSGHQFAVTLSDDQGQSGSGTVPNEDGALGLPGSSTFSSGQVIVTGGNADANGISHAFAVYRAPLDFARPTSGGFKKGTCQGALSTDDQLACRSVSIQVQDLTANTSLGTFPITVIRPMVSAIHGTWSNWRAWDNFSPLVSGNTMDSRFFVHRADYSYPVVITASTPTIYSAKQLQRASANSLGFQYNAPVVLTQMNKYLGSFKNGINPLGIPVAAIQADVVAHSLGGDIVRTMASLPQFQTDPNSPTFGQGVIHKVITIDTPHLGTPLASLLLDSNNACTARYMADHNSFSFTSVTLSGSTNSVSGAVGDLKPGSAALNNIASGPVTHLLPTALIVGIYANFTSLDPTISPAGWVRNQCINDPLAQSLTSDGWPGNFQNLQNDAIVDVNSQRNGFSSSSAVQFTGYVHSVGAAKLGFAKPTVLDPDVVAPQTINIPNQVINFLNTPYTNQSIFFLLNP